MYFALNYPSGGVIFLILLIGGIIAIFFTWLIIFLVLLISAMEEFRKTDKSDNDKLKSFKKKIIFRSIMTVIPLLLLAFWALR